MIKKHINSKEYEFISKNKKLWTIYTEEAKDIDELDLFEIIDNTEIEHHILPRININYLYYNKTLFVFSDNAGNSTTADIVMISPVEREEIEVSVEKIVEVTVNEYEIINAPEQNTESEKINEDTTNSKKEKDLLIKEISKQFNKKYCVIQSEFKGASFENKIIPLTTLYKKINIEQGRLMGQWRVFDKNSIDDLIDTGIVKKALVLCRKEYTYQIDGYGYFVPTEKKEAYLKALEKIENDYKKYVAGQKIEYVGKMKITKSCNLKSILPESKKALQNYLYNICNDKDKYKEEIDIYLDKEYSKLNDSKIELKISHLSYNDRQWENREFIEKVYKTFKKNKIDEEFLNLLTRYFNCKPLITKEKSHDFS